MNWGNKLLLVFIGFAALMLTMVYRCVRTPVELVTQEYYQDELAYQHVIDGRLRANALSRKVEISQQPGKILIAFPPELKKARISGYVLFYCPSDQSRDRHFSLQETGMDETSIDIASVVAGHYIIKINWRTADNQYYSEQPLNVLP